MKVRAHFFALEQSKRYSFGANAGSLQRPGKIRRALCSSQSSNLHGRERGSFPATKLNQRSIGVSDSVLPAGQQQSLSLTTLGLVFF